MVNRAIFLGASAGGVEALKDVIRELPEKLPAPVFVVLHIPPYISSALPKILAEAGHLPAIHPKNGASIRPGVIYVASPDHHLLTEKDHVLVKKGPKENLFRPSIDALFRSGAYTYRNRAIGVVLSGVLDDGTSGLWSIKRLGGTAIVQEPNEARFETMPRSALEYVEVDYTLTAPEIGKLLGTLVNETVRSSGMNHSQSEDKKRMATEIGVASEDDAFNKGVLELGELTPFTCPECHGVLVRVAEGKMSRFRCHTGHAYTDSALIEAVMEFSGELLWQVIRSLEEGVLLLEHMAKHLEKAGSSSRAAIFRSKSLEIKKRSEAYHKDVLIHESLSGDNLGQ
ncbi:MAG TPA: chemotaxis protein CheB [Bryobacteraceae bacterium]|jgi:two-component system chemotaxis response regulator CheB